MIFQEWTSLYKDIILHLRGPNCIGWPWPGSDKAELGLNPDNYILNWSSIETIGQLQSRVPKILVSSQADPLCTYIQWLFFYAFHRCWYIDIVSCPLFLFLFYFYFIWWLRPSTAFLSKLHSIHMPKHFDYYPSPNSFPPDSFWPIISSEFLFQLILP